MDEEFSQKSEQKYCDFHLAHTFRLFFLACFDEATCHIVSCSMEKPMWQKTENGLQFTAREELRPTVQQHTRNWILPTTTWVSWEAGPSPVEPWNDCGPSWYFNCSCIKDPEQEDAAKLHQDSWPYLTGKYTNGRWLLINWSLFRSYK